ncbi:MAG: glycosyltransferase family 9 protein [Chlamydiota bacterium]
MKKIVIVKTSSLGDVVQSFPVIPYLKNIFPNSSISWVVTSRLSSIINSHPLIDHTIELSYQGLKSLRKKKFDYLFDLQGNTKSALVTLLAKASVKVGYGKRSVREWPNLLVTDVKIDISKKQNISNFYVSLVREFFKRSSSYVTDSKVLLPISKKQKEEIHSLVKNGSPLNVMVCPHSKWKNKKLSFQTLSEFLSRLSEKYQPTFFLMSGSSQEALENKKLGSELKSPVKYLDKLPIEVWHNFMNEMDLVIAMDSSGLHLSATTSCPTYSVFGPTKASVFKPFGDMHGAFEGVCPFNANFNKQCPKLRTCKTGGCIKDIDPLALWQHFENWIDQQNIF